MKDFGSSLVVGLVEGIRDKQGELGGINATFKAFWASVAAETTAALNNIKANIVNKLGESNTQIQAQTANMARSFNTAWARIAADPSSAWGGMKSIVANKAGEIVAAASSTLSQSRFAAIGQNMARGLEQGLGDIARRLADKFHDAVAAIEEELGIHSPSTVMRDKIGLNMGLGVAAGLEASIPESVAAMRDLTGALDTPALTMPFDTAINSQGFSLMVLDMQGMWNQAWGEMIEKSMQQMAELEANGFDVGGMRQMERAFTAQMNANETDNSGGSMEDLIKAVIETGYSHDQLLAELLDMMENQESQIVWDDGTLIGKFRKAMNEQTARAGKTVFHN
jgi:hypothetical protein